MSVGKSGLRFAVSQSIKKLGYGGEFKFSGWCDPFVFRESTLQYWDINKSCFLLQMSFKWPNESWHTLRRAPLSYPESLGLIGQVQVSQRPFNKQRAVTVHPVFKYSIIFGIFWIPDIWHQTDKSGERARNGGRVGEGRATAGEVKYWHSVSLRHLLTHNEILEVLVFFFNFDRFQVQIQSSRSLLLLQHRRVSKEQMSNRSFLFQLVYLLLQFEMYVLCNATHIFLGFGTLICITCFGQPAHMGCWTKLAKSD